VLPQHVKPPWTISARAACEASATRRSSRAAARVERLWHPAESGRSPCHKSRLSPRATARNGGAGGAGVSQALTNRRTPLTDRERRAFRPRSGESRPPTALPPGRLWRTRPRSRPPAGAANTCSWPTAAAVLRRRAHRPRRPPSPGCRPLRPADQRQPALATRKETTSGRGTPPTRRDSRAARHSPALKEAVSHRVRPPSQDHERCRLAAMHGAVRTGILFAWRWVS
jgi:hypothetical protein